MFLGGTLCLETHWVAVAVGVGKYVNRKGPIKDIYGFLLRMFLFCDLIGAYLSVISSCFSSCEGLIPAEQQLY